MTNPWRYRLIVCILLLTTVGLLWRMVDLMILNRSFLKGQGDARSIRDISIPAYRGMITDRNGEPLAISTPVYSVWVEPTKFNPATNNINQLANLTNLDTISINKIISKRKHSHFVYIKRDLDPITANKIINLSIEGVYVTPEFKRFYPEGEATAQLVGLTNVDDHGQEGIELAYDNWLQGTSGKKRVLKDREGHTVANLEIIEPSKPGHNLVLSIDRRIQYLAYRELKEAVAKYKARSGSIVVLDVQTGEVLAMVNQPSFNPNDRSTIDNNNSRNRAMTDVFEPGSTIKPFSVTNALVAGKFTPETIIDTSPGWIYVNHKKVEDDEEKNHGQLTVTGVLQVSSNVGVTKMTLSLPQESLWNFLNSVGFGHTTATGFPGESAGVLNKYKVWNPFVLATLSFGYGLSVTNLQLAHAYSTLASYGNERPVSLIKLPQPNSSTKIIDSKVAEEVDTMLESVIDEGGTATRAKIPGYKVSGKTGTVRMAGPNGYEKHHHIGIFVGMAPATDPKLIVSVVIVDPSTGPARIYYGGLVAAPIFAQVMGGALRELNIAPDDIGAKS